MPSCLSCNPCAPTCAPDCQHQRLSGSVQHEHVGQHTPRSVGVGNIDQVGRLHACSRQEELGTHSLRWPQFTHWKPPPTRLLHDGAVVAPAQLALQPQRAAAALEQHVDVGHAQRRRPAQQQARRAAWASRLRRACSALHLSEESTQRPPRTLKVAVESRLERQQPAAFRPAAHPIPSQPHRPLFHTTLCRP